jgi:hypothetical protein
MDAHIHGATTTARLQADGVGRRARRTMVERGSLVVVRDGLFVHGASPETPERLAGLGILANKERAVVTGALAVRWHGVPVAGSFPVDLVIPEGDAAALLEGVRVRRSSHLHGVRCEERLGLPVVPLAWALGDLARDISDRQLATVIAAAIGLGLITLDGLISSFTVRPKFPGSARLRRVIDQLAGDMAFSGTELRAARHLRRAGYPVLLNHPVLDGSGRLIRKADLALLDIPLDLEVDGPHHWLPHQAAIDRRQDASMRDNRWVVERVPVYDVDEDLDVVIRVVERVLRRR